MKAFIPNLITLLNLFMGCVGVYFAMKGDLIAAAYCSCLGICFDFFDGLVARLLHVSSELGKQLDSLADLVTSGLVPSLVIFQLFYIEQKDTYFFVFEKDVDIKYIAFTAFLVTLASAYRLANFNIDENQTDKFIGLPTPANTILILSIPFILYFENIVWINEMIISTPFLVTLTILSAFLLNMNVELFSLKIKSFRISENKVLYSFLLFTIVLLFIFKFLAIPLIIFSYIIISILSKKKSA